MRRPCTVSGSEPQINDKGIPQGGEENPRPVTNSGHLDQAARGEVHVGIGFVVTIPPAPVQRESNHEQSMASSMVP